MKTKPQIVIERTVVFELPAEVAKTLVDMFSYGSVAPLYHAHITESISAKDMDRATLELRDAITPSLTALRMIDDAIAASGALVKR